MSTKAIRHVLAWVIDGKAPRPEVMDAAEREVEAIEKAAKELLEIWGYARHGIESEQVVESIAKDAP